MTNQVSSFSNQPNNTFIRRENTTANPEFRTSIKVIRVLNRLFEIGLGCYVLQKNPVPAICGCAIGAFLAYHTATASPPLPTLPVLLREPRPTEEDEIEMAAGHCIGMAMASLYVWWNKPECSFLSFYDLSCSVHNGFGSSFATGVTSLFHGCGAAIATYSLTRQMFASRATPQKQH